MTPKPQGGNPRPRLFRLPQDRALINRLGFNGEGLERVRARLALRRPDWGVIGANIGANRDAADPTLDYVTCLRGLYPLVDYVTVNVSSPNTPGLRRLQHGSRLEALLAALTDARRELATGPVKPILLKIAPDLEADEERAIAATALTAGIDGLIVGNTTLARPEGAAQPASRPGGRPQRRAVAGALDRAACAHVPPDRRPAAAGRRRRHRVRRRCLCQDPGRRQPRCSSTPR